MQPLDITCPECGAPVGFRGTAVSAVCEYCNSTVVRSGVEVSLIGKVSALIDNGSPILLNSKGRFTPQPVEREASSHAGQRPSTGGFHGRGDMPFVVSGRLQVSYERGTWNEWFLEFADGTIGWLSDAQNQFALVRPIDPNQIAGRVPTYNQFNLGAPYRIAGRIAVAVDRRGAAYKGAEGLLPFEAEPGMSFYGVDLRGYQGEFITLDWGTDPRHTEPTPYVGRAVSLDEINLFPLRRFEGWPPAKPPSTPSATPS